MKLTLIFILLSGATLQIVKSQVVSQSLEQTQITTQEDTKTTVGYAENLGSSMYNSAMNGLSWIKDEFYGTPNPVAPAEDSLKNKASLTSETVKSSMSSTSATIKNDMPDSLNNAAYQTGQSMKSSEYLASNKMNEATNYAGEKINSADINTDNDMSKIKAQLNSYP